MKEWNIVIVDFDGIKRLVSVVEKKELFIKGDLVKNTNLLVAIDANLKHNASVFYEDVPLKKINTGIKIISQEGTIEEFSLKNKNELEKIKNLLKKQNIHASWLQIFQLVELEKTNNDLIKSMEILEQFYKKHLEKNEEDMDFMEF